MKPAKVHFQTVGYFFAQGGHRVKISIKTHPNKSIGGDGTRMFGALFQNSHKREWAKRVFMQTAFGLEFLREKARLDTPEEARYALKKLQRLGFISVAEVRGVLYIQVLYGIDTAEEFFKNGLGPIKSQTL